MQSKICIVCGKEFFKTPNLSQRAWELSRKYCSIPCRVKDLPMPKRKTPYPSGADHPSWKGDKVGYFALHAWVNKVKGRANHCGNPNCQTKSPKKFEWSNISGEYKRDIDDYESLCTWCHRKKDLNGKIPWNKGKHTGNFGNGFKKGNVPWNKGRRGVQVAWNKGIPNSGFKKGYVPWNKKCSVLY